VEWVSFFIAKSCEAPTIVRFSREQLQNLSFQSNPQSGVKNCTIPSIGHKNHFRLGRTAARSLSS
jgi:hypothetical protein